MPQQQDFTDHISFYTSKTLLPFMVSRDTLYESAVDTPNHAPRVDYGQKGWLGTEIWRTRNANESPIAHARPVLREHHHYTYSYSERMNKRLPHMKA